MELFDRSDLDACLTVAKLMVSRGHVCHAERVYKSLLKQAEMFEDDAYMTGVVLLDLHEFYEKQGRHDEAAPVWERIRKILLNGFQQWQKAKS